MNELEALLERLEVFGYRFPQIGGDNLSKQSYDAARKAIKIGQSAGGAGASVFRTREADPDTGDPRGPWYVMVVDDGCKIRERIPWIGGTEVPINSETRKKLIERFLMVMVENSDEKGVSSLLAHYGKRGAHLHRGGQLDPRIGQG